MPRPKRTKVASRVAATRVAQPPVTTQDPPKKTTTKEITDSFSDDSDGLVVKSRKPSCRRRALQAELEDYSMSGALPVEDTEPQKEAEAAPTKAQSGNPIARSDNNLAPSATTRQTVSAPDGASIFPGTGAVSGEESSLLDPSLLTFGSLDEDSPAHGTRPPSAIKVSATPAHETSILALTNFKRRPRQPSLLRMVHQTTDLEDNDHDDLDSFGDFSPDKESTPLHPRKSGQGANESAANESSLLSPHSETRKRRKVSSPVIQVPRSSPPYEAPSRIQVANSQPSRASSPSLPEDVVETQENASDDALPEPEDLSGIMAPPRSSSPVPDENEQPVPEDVQLKGRGRRSRTVRKDDEDGGGKAKATRQKPATAISTAKLEALLPRRRTRATRRQRDEYDINSSDESDDAPIDSDQDELQLPARRLARQPKKANQRKTSRTAKKAAPAAEKGRRTTKTYGRRTSSDKENPAADDDEVDVSGSTEPTEVSVSVPSSTLAAIAKKFEDVDAWEMDFETVDVGGGSSSPWR
ncbi:hypothetical protein M011DRAFT_399994 [Sporormia fimetaria CBS 119925]|uniref:Uncharacterized protein n=1 Tax=Sporormia fimetaria CBS 119925 TaxID=1340428 RepID=A0A6A6VGC2_9PLEO|nr:hypothetical protein M011DRAFT_399994 [Sporormia fimetaria CBS 119925]